MRKSLHTVCIALIVAVAASAQAADQSENNFWEIGPRILPPPDGASAQLRELLAKMPTPAMPEVPVTIEGWKTLIAESDAMSAAAAQAFAQQMNLQVAEEYIAGVHVYRVTPPEISPEHVNHVFVHIHGGAFIKGGGPAALGEANEIAAFLKMPVLSIDYRMAPDHPAPAAMDDVVAVWREVIKNYPANTIALGGTFAGGNLALVATLKMKELGLDMPGALFVGTPAADLANNGDARYINDGIDRNLYNWDTVAPAIAMYVGDGKYDDPYLSPIHGAFNGFPPTYLISGTRDLMLSDTVRTHRKLREAGVDADLHVYEGIAHADYLTLLGIPEMAEHYGELNKFVVRHLAKPTTAAQAEQVPPQ